MRKRENRSKQINRTSLAREKTKNALHHDQWLHLRNEQPLKARFPSFRRNFLWENGSFSPIAASLIWIGKKVSFLSLPFISVRGIIFHPLESWVQILLLDCGERRRKKRMHTIYRFLRRKSKNKKILSSSLGLPHYRRKWRSLLACLERKDTVLARSICFPPKLGNAHSRHSSKNIRDV